MTRIMTRARIRTRVPAAPVGLTWVVGLSQDSMNEGASVNLTVSVALNGYVPAVGEFVHVTLTTISAQDFASQFPGETQALTASGDFTTGYTTAMKTAIEALGGTGVTTTLADGTTAIVLGFKIDTFTSVQITRASAVRSGDNGSRRLVHQILTPTVGTISTAMDSVVILDISAPPEVGDLVTATLSANRLAAPTFAGVNVAINTRIGEIKGFDQAAVEVPLNSVTLSNTEGGRFKITQETTHFYLDVASADVNFRSLPGLEGKPQLFYLPIAQVTAGAITITLNMTIEPVFPVITPAGGSAEVLVTTAQGLETQLGNGLSGKVVKIDPSLTGVQRPLSTPRTVTITIASPAVIDWGAQGTPPDNTEFILSTTGALPTGLTNGGYYYVTNRSATTSNICATRKVNTGSGWIAQPTVNTSGSQSGTHSVTYNQSAGVVNVNRAITTWVGHKRYAMNRGRGFVFNNGTDIVVIDMAFRVGASACMSANPQIGGSGGLDVDNFVCGDNATAATGNIWFINCSFSHSNDELCRAKNGTYYPRGIRFTNCLFAEPMTQANHSKGTYHPLGPALSPGCENVLFEYCLFIGMANRMPNSNRSVGMTLRNSVIVGWSNNTDRGATQITQSEVGAGYNVWSGRIQGNLYDAVPTGSTTLAQHRAVAIQAKNIEDSNSVYAYVPSTGNYRNYHIRQATNSFGDDPLTIGDGIYLGTNPASMIKDQAYYGISVEPSFMQTSTEAQRRAVWDRVINYVGVRDRTGGGYAGVLANAVANDGTGDLIPGDSALNAFDYDVVSTYRTTGLPRTVATGPTVAMVDEWYGKGWNGGGSLTHGMADTVFPNAATTGVPAGTTLTASGQIESNVPAVVIEDKDVTGAIVLSSNADGAIIRRCRITTDTFVGIYIIGASDVLIEDCEITTSSPSGSKAITLEDCTGAIVRRCNMHHCEDGVFMNGSGHQILSNYIHDMASGGGDPHFDCVQLVGGTTSSVSVIGNYLDGNTGPGASSAITMGAVQNITIRNNYITGGGYGLSMDDRFPPAAAPMENMVVTDNRFGTHVYGPVTVEESLGEWTTGELTWSGNVVDATGATIAKP